MTDSNTKNPLLIPFIIISSAFAVCLILILTYFIIPAKKIIVVSPDLISKCRDNADSALTKKHIHFLSPEEIFVKKSKASGIKTKIIASISSEKEVPLIKNPCSPNQRTYFLSKKAIFPCIKDDFSERKLAPDESISFSYAESIPLGERALLADGLYADSEDYCLTENSQVRVSVFDRKTADLIFDWCEKTFVYQEDKAENTVIISSVGDIMVARGVQEVLLGDDGVNKVFGDTLPLIKDSDFAIGNLEGVVTDSWENAIKTYTFKFKKAILPKLLDAGFDYLMQTNNHCYDYGESGFKDTLKAFEEYKVPTSGVGYNLEEAKQFYHTEVKGLKLAVISCGAFPVERSGFDGRKTATATDKRAGILWESDELLESVKKEKEKGYFVIVNVHGGEEYHFSPSKKQRAFYESLCENGADLVFGSHPHVLQKSEWYRGSLIVYSMGNFIFNGMEDMKGGTDSEVVRVGVTGGNISYVEHYPVKIGVNTVSLK